MKKLPHSSTVRSSHSKRAIYDLATDWSGSYITPSTCRKLVSISTSKAIDTIEYWFSVVTIQFYNPPTALTSL